MSVKRCNFLLEFNLRIKFFSSSYLQELSLWIAGKTAKNEEPPAKVKQKNLGGSTHGKFGRRCAAEAFKT